VDPNDGTRDYLLGRRGSSVSIGLVHERRPCLGVIFAFAYPDDRGDLFAWAEGSGPLRRQDRELEVRLPGALGVSDVVLVSSGADRDAEGNLRGAAPARYRTLPSIAHRLAVVAAGEAAAAASVYAPGAWDYAAGQALLRASGGTLVDEHGREVGYGADGSSSTRRAFAGAPSVAATLSTRPWELLGAGGGDWPVRLRRGEAVRDADRLGRAQGCLLGLIAADSARAFAPDRDLEDEPGAGRLAGQPRCAGEMALALGRSMVREGGFAPAAAREAYREWSASQPPDRDGSEALQARAAVLGIFAHAMAPDRAAELARADAALDGAPDDAAQAAAALAAAVARAVESGEGEPLSLRGPVATGARFGATRGRAALPAQWRQMVLSCRAHALRTHRPRPRTYWPVDVMEIAERLLLAGEAAAGG
jgi:ADP-ribosyl-[dinitrogen reductase] hydrolase